MRLFSLKAVAFSVITLAAAVSAQADDIVFDNFSNTADGLTSGTSIGAAINTGNVPLLFMDVVFPQLDRTTPGTVKDTYVSTETFAIYTRTGSGTLGTLVSSNFSFTHDGNSTSGTYGQTDAIANTPVFLAANSSYYMVLGAATGTGWQFSNNNAYNSADGVFVPSGNIAFETGGPMPGYKTTGTQLANLDANVATVPEAGSSFCLFLLGAGAIFAARKVLLGTVGSMVEI